MRRWHAENLESSPYETPADWPNVWPYGIWITEDAQQIMFARTYQPMWRRYPNQPARVANPQEWIDWRVCYFLHDDAPSPEHSKRLRQSLLAVVEEFITGGRLLIRDWEGRGRGIPKWGGMLIERFPLPPIKVVVDNNDKTHD
jgi:hypothetical protein